MTTTLSAGRTTGIVINGVVHILKRSSSRYHLSHAGLKGQYCCQDGCCDRGLQSDVADVVNQAKELGATKVIVRTGQRSYYLREIAGLPVEDVSNHVGEIGDGSRIFAAW